jgi:hypothetical protein
MVALVLIFYFSENIWQAIKWIAGWIGFFLWCLWEALATVLSWIWRLLVTALELAGSALVIVVAIVMVLVAFAMGIGLLMFLSLMMAGYIGGKLKEIGQQVRELHLEFRVESGRAARDAAFLTLVATLCALIAYMGTEEFLKHMSTVRFLAICGIGLVAGKIFLFFPSRIPKLSGVFLTIVILAGSTLFVGIRYRLAEDFGSGFTHLREVIIDPENQLKLLLVVMIAMFSLLTLLFPFTATEWRRLLAVPRSQLSGPIPAELIQTVVLAQKDLAQIRHE